ncbi:MAG: PAS domain S-box protein [Proteobacteria bacterium]|nr:PAS domain S-box protein [Pseudomonadota bacterium]
MARDRAAGQTELAALFDQPAVGVKRVALGGRLLAVNRKLCELLGYDSAELLQLRVAEITHPEDRERELQLIDQLTGQDACSYSIEKRQIGRTGAEIWTRVTATLALDGASGAPVWIALVEDIDAHRRAGQELRLERQATERRLNELQTELLHASRINEMGQLASALAHELNQPLTAANSYIGAVRRMVQSGSASVARLLEIMDKASAQIGRAGQTIHRLRTLIEKGETERATHDLNAVVQEASALALIGAQHASVHLSMALATLIPPVLIDRIQVQQVILNLVRNAVEAMSGVERRHLTLATRQVDDAYAEVSVSDTGPGLPPEIAARLFRPFVSTKPTGLGIGLSICRSIVDAHGGNLRADRNSDGGTVFAFTLPLAAMSDGS